MSKQTAIAEVSASFTPKEREQKTIDEIMLILEKYQTHLAASVAMPNGDVVTTQRIAVVVNETNRALKESTTTR